MRKESTDIPLYPSPSRKRFFEERLFGKIFLICLLSVDIQCSPRFGSIKVAFRFDNDTFLAAPCCCPFRSFTRHKHQIEFTAFGCISGMSEKVSWHFLKVAILVSGVRSQVWRRGKSRNCPEAADNSI